MKELRPYQATTIENIRATLRNGVKRMIVSGPCGFGKTLVAATIANGALSKGKRMTFCCPAVALIDQTVEAFYAEGCRDVGVIQSDHHLTDYSKPIQICSVQTISRRNFFPESDVVVLDEVHHWFKVYEKWLSDPLFINIPFIGLTATPLTKGLGKHFETLLVAATTQELIDQGYLSKFKVFATGHPDLTGVDIVAGDFHEGQLSEAMQKGTLTADIVKTWMERWGKDRTLCFAVDCAHAQALQKRFEEAGISCGYQDANTPPDERREIKRKFYSGEFRVVSSVGTLTTGVDWPVMCIVFARPTKSPTLFVQCIGRGLRTAPDKDALILLDHSDTTSRLGFVTDILVDRLDDGKPKEKAKAAEPKLPKPCPQCSFLKKTLVCPNCGFKPEVVSGIMERDGELVELRPGEIPKQQKKAPKREYTMDEKAAFYGELKTYAREKGYKEGWCAMKFREKFSVFPNHPSIKGTPAIPVSFETTRWLKHQFIKWINGKDATPQPPRLVGLE